MSFATPHTLPGPLGSPISPSPRSSNISYDEVHPASITSPPLSPPPPSGSTYNTSYSPSYSTAHGTFTNSMIEKSPVKRLYHPGIVRNLDPTFGIDVTSSVANDPVTTLSDHSVSQNPPVLNRIISTGQASTSRPPPHNATSTSTTGLRTTNRPAATIAPARSTQGVDLLIPIIHYTGQVDIHMFPTIGQDNNSEAFHPCLGAFQVLGLTSDVLILVRTDDIDHMLHVLCCNLTHLIHGTEPTILLHQKLELLCNEMHSLNILRDGNNLTIAVMPNVLKSLTYAWYIMPEGGAYVYDSWVSQLMFNPNIIVLDIYQAGYGRREGKTGRLVTLDHPLHIALFENNTQMDQPPHLRT
jgi:hypothetical protein